MPVLSSKKNERRILALLLKKPTHMRALRLNLDWFVHPARRQAAELIKKYVIKYKNPPSMSTLKSFADKLAERNVDTAEKLVTALQEIATLPKVKTADAKFEFDQAENYWLGRLLVDMSEGIRSKFEHGDSDYRAMRNSMVTELLTISTEDDTVRRGMIYETVRERADEYQTIAKGELGEVIPFGIKSLDLQIGGMRKSFVTLLYSKTAGGKTRTAINIAYNAAQAGFNVMYMSLEMSFNLLASCFDSRMAWVDSQAILLGRLDSSDIKKYSKALKEQCLKKLNIWIVDISMGMRSNRILEEIELYKAARGVSPDLLIIDYANIMEPEKKYNGRSEKYDFLFSELHEYAKFARVAILTATQESRDASKADINSKKKKEDAEEGVHNIGLSNYMAPHCENVIRLKQDGKDKLQNRLWAVVDKNRYGKSGLEIPLIAIWDKTYVGDKVVGGMKIHRAKPQVEPAL